MDIPRLCRALAVPGQLAENFIKTDSKAEQYAAEELYKIQAPINQIVQTLQRHFYFKNDEDDNNNLIISNLNKTQKEAIYTDINELAVYSKMYCEIETVKLDPLISNEYPHGNPFDHIIDNY